MAALSRKIRTFATFCIKIFLLLFFIVLILGSGHTWVIELPLRLLLGWIGYVRQTLPEVQPSIPAISLALLLIAVMIPLTHCFAAFVYRETIKDGATETLPRQWRLSWTITWLIVMVLMFSSGVAIVGVVHQSVWLLRGPEPLLKGDSRLENYFALSNFIQHCHDVLDESDSSDAAAEILSKLHSDQYFHSLLETHQYFVVPNPQKKIDLVFCPTLVDAENEQTTFSCRHREFAAEYCDGLILAIRTGSEPDQKFQR